MKGKSVFSVVLVALYLVAQSVWGVFSPMIQGSLGVHQFDDSIAANAVALAGSRTNVVSSVLSILLAVILVLMWRKEIVSLLKRARTRLLVALSIATVILTGCIGSVPKGTTVVQILPNQTAFLLPAQGATSDQATFDSAKYLETKKVASKIVEISYTKHDLGITPNNFDWTPNELLVIVDRSPVSRQWLKSGDATASASDSAIGLESLESIGFYHGVALNAAIQEEDAATFLYWFGGTTKVNSDSKVTGILYSVSLENIMDTVVKSWVAKELYSEFKLLDLKDDQVQAAAIFSRVEERAKTFFKQYGITIISLGGVQGLVYDSTEVQNNIDKTFSAQSLATVQGIDNAKNIAKAQADAEVLRINAEAQAKANQLIGDSLSKNPLIINKTLADKSTGQVPQVLVMQDGTGQQMPFPFFYTLPTPTATPTK